MGLNLNREPGTPLGREAYNQKNANWEALEQDSKNKQAQMDKLVAEGDSSPAAAQASVGADGTTYGSLKTRLDEEYNATHEKIDRNKSETAAQLAEMETQANHQADKDYLENMINTAFSGMGDPYDTLADLQAAFPTGDSKPHVVTADGNWYFWSTVAYAWTSGGVFQSTQISPNYIDIAMIKYKYLGFFRGTAIIDYKNQTVSFVNGDFISQDGHTYYPNTGGPFICDISEQTEDKLYHVCATLVNNQIVGVTMVDNDSITSDKLIILSICNGHFYAPYTPQDNIQVVDVNGRLRYIEKNSWGLITDYQVIIVDKQHKVIKFPGRSDGKITVSSKDYSRIYVAPTDTIDTIDISSFLNGPVYAIYFDYLSLTFNCVKYDSIPNNVFVIATFKMSDDSFTFAGNENAFIVYDINGIKISPRKLSLPKTLNMPHYIHTDNIDSGYYSNAYFLGRWTRRTINGTDCMYTPNLGSTIFSKVKNTTKVSFGFLNNGNPSGNPQEIAYSVDGGVYTRDSVDHSPFVITGLDGNEHYIRIVMAGNKDTDAVWSGDQGFAFTGISVDEGGLSEPVKPKARVFEFFGDSITAGCWVLTRDTPSQGYAAEANYVAKCCEMLRSIDVRVAFSASGVTKGGTGGVPALQTFLDQTDALTPEKADLPDAVFINIGTNDSAATSSDFQNAYQNAVNRLQIKRPGVPIFCMLPFNGARKTEIRAVVSASVNTVFVDTTGWDITTVDGTHPDQAGSIVAGEKLAAFVINYYGKDYFMV